MNMREMKDSGIEWIGQVPSDWMVRPIRADFIEVTEKNKFGRVKKALKFTYGRIIPKDNFDADEDSYVADTILNYTIVRPTHHLINTKKYRNSALFQMLNFTSIPVSSDISTTSIIAAAISCFS